ncbi:acyl-CoA dehydrogenase family protein [Aeromicrobium sp. UC242_57]|uniref:acyl-CoA dehydrogenase family protein n=1 Tax=Aeromicrobium sp. UC242_57 TaxID=3374624 RepID=UPI0037A969A4
MNPEFSPEAEQFREQIRAFLAEHLPSDWAGLGSLATDEAKGFTERWRSVLASTGYLVPAWPQEFGGAGLTKLQQVVMVEEFAKAGVPANGANDNFSIKMIGNLLLKLGTPEQKAHFLPRIVSGEDRWCQGFSEPGAGSDLASLTTKARLEGDEWVIDGQKVWTSEATKANWIFVLARTRPHRVATQGHQHAAGPTRSGGHRGPADSDDHGRVFVQRGVLHRRPDRHGEYRPGCRPRLEGRYGLARSRAGGRGRNEPDHVPC